MSVAIFVSCAPIEASGNYNLSFMESKGDVEFIWTKIKISCTTFKAAGTAQSV
jgi:hypothetical protein